MRRKIKNVLHSKLKNRRITLVKTDGGYGIFTKTLFRNWEGEKVIWKESIALSDEAMMEVVSMWCFMQDAKGKQRHVQHVQEEAEE